MNAAKIVLIEDNPADVLLVEIALTESGIPYLLTRFKSGQEAAEALCGPSQEAGPLPDAILLDLNTPRSDGFEVYTRLKQTPRLANVPIAIVTSSRAASDKHRAAIQGARYIEKPSQIREFLQTIGYAVKDMLDAS